MLLVDSYHAGILLVAGQIVLNVADRSLQQCRLVYRNCLGNLYFECYRVQCLRRASASVFDVFYRTQSRVSLTA